VRGPGAVPLARQHARQAADPPGGIVTAHRGPPPADQLARRLQFLLVADDVDGVAQDVVIDAAPA